jgi:hypothetical protein
VALTLAWADTDTGLAHVENGLWLEASLVGGTQRIGAADWSALSRDYLIHWQALHMRNTLLIKVQFPPSQTPLALQMLQDLLHGAALDSHAVAQWRQETMNHYRYYHRDPDSLMKWWAMGTEEKYKSIDKLALKPDKNGILGCMGYPQVVTCAGPADSTLLSWLGQVSTAPVPVNWRITTQLPVEKSRPKLGLIGQSVAQVVANDPLSGMAAWLQHASQVGTEAWLAHGPYFHVLIRPLPIDALSSLPWQPMDDYWLEEAWELWLLKRERNADLSVAMSMVALGIWPAHLLDNQYPDTDCGPLIISEFHMK